MAPTLLIVTGPPAVGKMAVGHEIATRTGLRLFHNHLAIEPVLRLFDFGTPPFHRLVEGFRSSVFEEVAASDLPGLIFTYVWAFDHPEDHEAVEELRGPVPLPRRRDPVRRTGRDPRRAPAPQRGRVPPGGEAVEARP